MASLSAIPAMFSALPMRTAMKKAGIRNLLKILNIRNLQWKLGVEKFRMHKNRFLHIHAGFATGFDRFQNIAKSSNLTEI